ncbi:MAG TPA: hypothetical protein PK402_04590, partial [Tepidisphaeraceae bacterium]|nr:hypothetical protein [Tepidisphaeraceae bacterium]
ARLTGWDVDILTPQEFQANVERLDRTLKEVEGINQEMVDRIVALGLIDVRDIEEVGEGPLQEDVGMSPELAEAVVDRCIEEAKIVAKEQEVKKKAEEVARAAGLPRPGSEAAKALAAAELRASEGGTPDLLAAMGVENDEEAAALEAQVGQSSNDPESESHKEGSDILTQEEAAVEPSVAVSGEEK